MSHSSNRSRGLKRRTLRRLENTHEHLPKRCKQTTRANMLLCKQNSLGLATFYLLGQSLSGYRGLKCPKHNPETSKTFHQFKSTDVQLYPSRQAQKAGKGMKNLFIVLFQITAGVGLDMLNISRYWLESFACLARPALGRTVHSGCLASFIVELEGRQELVAFLFCAVQSTTHVSSSGPSKGTLLYFELFVATSVVPDRCDDSDVHS